MIESRHNNMQLLKNILPDHVAHHFLTADRAPEVRETRHLVLFDIFTASLLKWPSSFRLKETDHNK